MEFYELLQIVSKTCRSIFQGCTTIVLLVTRNSHFLGWPTFENVFSRDIIFHDSASHSSSSSSMAIYAYTIVYKWLNRPAVLYFIRRNVSRARKEQKMKEIHRGNKTSRGKFMCRYKVEKKSPAAFWIYCEFL